MSATGGGPAKKIKLLSLEKRLYNILSRDLGEPLRGVRHRQEARRRLPRQEINNAALADSRDRLERIKSRNAAAILSQAEATRNLSDAIDRLGEKTLEAVNNMATATTQAATILAAAIEKIAHSLY